jgi:hypothetical protein
MQEAEDFPRGDRRSQVDHPGVQAWVRIAGSILFLSYPHPQLSYGRLTSALRRLWMWGGRYVRNQKGKSPNLGEPLMEPHHP